MQGRMKQFHLSMEEIEKALMEIKMGHLATFNEDGMPYVTPIHFVYVDGKIYIHGLKVGQKISNVRRDERVGFEAAEFGMFIPGVKTPCDTNTEFRSVICTGKARMVEEEDEHELRLKVFNAFVDKFTPQLKGLPFVEKMVMATGVIEVTPIEITGKYYKE